MIRIGVQYQCPVFTHLGGNANNGVNAGVFYWNLNNDSSNRNRNIGAHANPQSNAVKILTPHLLVKSVATKSLVGKPKNLAGGCRK
jgi:hypothetical protein